MFAVICLGNQQFKVKAGDFIRTPFQNKAVAETVEIPVLAFCREEAFLWDQAQLKKARVKVLLVRQCLSPKTLVFKKKRRKGYRRTQGHRQKITVLKILELHSPEGKISRAEEKTPSHSKSLKKAKAENKEVMDKKGKVLQTEPASSPAKSKITSGEEKSLEKKPALSAKDKERKEETKKTLPEEKKPQEKKQAKKQEGKQLQRKKWQKQQQGKKIQKVQKQMPRQKHK